MKNKGVCYLIGAGTHYNNHTIMPDRDDYVIAVDGGIHYLASNNITPHLHLGDMDSLSKDPIPFHVDTITFPPQKDDTDMCLAAKEGFEHGYDTFLIYGGTGGRMDHTLSNIQLLSWIANHGGIGYLFDADYTITVLHNRTLSLTKQATKFSGFLKSKKNGYISILSLSDISKGITIQGLKYEVSHSTMNNSNSLGTSNEFIGQDCTISVVDGTLVVVTCR